MIDELTNAFLVVLVILVFSTVLVLFGCVHLSIPETGSHTGYITETGTRGLIWPTKYVKVVDSHFSTGGADSDYKSYWYYGIDDELFSKAQESQKTDTLIRIDYQCRLIVPAWQYSEGCIIEKIE